MTRNRLEQCVIGYVQEPAGFFGGGGGGGGGGMLPEQLISVVVAPNCIGRFPPNISLLMKPCQEVQGDS